VGVSAEIGEHRLGPGEGLLGWQSCGAANAASPAC
jgi:hypothetical protein